LRDLAGTANVERLLAGDIVGERLSPDVAHDDASADVVLPSAALRPEPGGGGRVEQPPICSATPSKPKQ
jgi:hypothetical protein